MKRINIILWIVLFALRLGAETLWNEDNDIYSNKKKFKVGDRLKIVFNEKSLVDYNLSLSETSRLTGSSGGGKNVMFFDFLPSLSADDGFNVSQKSSTKNQSVLSKNITVEIVQVLTNLNLKISGKHYIKVNDSMEQVLIDGVVNPDDVRNKKYVYSTDILNPSIIYNSLIVKQDVLGQNDFKETFVTNRIVVSGVTQVKVSSKYDVAEKKKQEMILQYLNKILTILFK